MIEFCPLFSGSNGNSTLIEYQNTCVLIDAGVSGKKITDAVCALGKNARDIAGIFITHEHSDHIQSAGILSRKYNIPIFATRGTWQELRRVAGNIERDNIRIIKHGEDTVIGSLAIRPFLRPHDAAEPVGYNIFAGNKKVSIATDIGAMNDELFLNLAKSDLVLLESNHDVDMLRYGPYSPTLKTRILGKSGHLSNDEAAPTCARLMSGGTRHFILGHLSGENNNPDLAYRTTADTLARCGARVGENVFLSVADRGTSGRLVTI